VKPDLSVVMPVHNEAGHLGRTIEALSVAVARSSLSVELVVVDDGSTDGSADLAGGAVAERLPLRIVSQPNLGRFAARRAGVEAASAAYVFLLDGRVSIEPDALAFVGPRLADGQPVWTGHVHVEAGRNLYGIFWQLLAELAWSDYFGDPRTTSFGVEEFDRFPKGTGCFIAPRDLLLEAIDAFRTRYADVRHANDDAPMIRWIAGRARVHVSPLFASAYEPRRTLRAFVRHSLHRGVVFVDGHGRRESRFFPVVVAFYPVSALLALAALRRPTFAARATTLAALGGSALGIAYRRKPLEVLVLGLLTPVYAVCHGAGMWRGLLMFRPRSR
jgi:glycosyltransferase involved in cell wall biosynthesis